MQPEDDLVLALTEGTMAKDRQEMWRGRRCRPKMHGLNFLAPRDIWRLLTQSSDTTCRKRRLRTSTATYRSSISYIYTQVHT